MRNDTNYPIRLREGRRLGRLTDSSIEGAYAVNEDSYSLAGLRPDSTTPNPALEYKHTLGVTLYGDNETAALLSAVVLEFL